MTLGVVLLMLGIQGDLKFMRTLKAQRERLIATGLTEGLEPLPRSLAIVGAIGLLLVGLAAIFAILLDF